MAENDNNPGQGGEVDPSEDPGPNARASSTGQEQGGGRGDRDEGGKGDEPSASGKGINPVQHSE